MPYDSLTIAGAGVDAPTTFPVIDPALGEAFAEAPECTVEQLDGAFEAARGALGSWAADEDARRQALVGIADAIDGATEELAKTLTQEQGKPLGDARWEVVLTAQAFRYYAELETGEIVLQDDDAAFVRTVRRPLGVVAAITPWNFPLALMARKVAPALLGGNTVVLKPSPFTPLSTLGIGRVTRDVLPAGVFNVVSGSDSLGAAMTSHPTPRAVTFTGSIPTGKAIYKAAADDLKRVTLELGGNDPAIVLPDADVAAIAPMIYRTAFVNNGQVCSCVKRVYVPKELQSDMVDALAELARAARLGNGFDDDIDLGPINNAPQLERIQGLVQDAVDRGGRLASGGKQPDGLPGYFFEPTIITDVTDGARIVDEEQFGPVLPVVVYDGDDDVVARANATMYGLDASVWGEDAEHVSSIANRLECGTVWMNIHAVRGADHPTGGHKWSGIGTENGAYGYEELTEQQVLYSARP